ncbi:GTP cyclohydrolase II [Cognatiyoonia sp. IB215182]|uniref:GTP cyclohydrolase II n=1 Tax=Cognatiyoonia sp. IB215182 TaxID=3097353 RepID=UPI002A0E036A|nr:GTP cyclohydrolase II [Cognatiyoonia sp. IB215182]MDX8352522.1 GTP cyclohydrolase II [Cognatiyoonia sp. IB215182]
MGLPCLLRHAEKQYVAVAIETLDPARFDALMARFGTPELVITPRRAATVMTAAAASNIAEQPVRIRPPENAELGWYTRLADTQFDKPGALLGPLHVVRQGDDTIPRLAVQLVKMGELLPAALLFDAGGDPLHGLSLIPLEAHVALQHLAHAPALAPVAAASLPLEAHDTTQLHVFRDPNGRAEHYAIEIGYPDRSKPVLSRLHSACFTGDVLGSLKCDCGPQLQAALAQMGAEGSGVLLYLNQEGRGIGLANKMRVYDLQSQGFDTVEANHRLGFEDDERDFRVGASMLRTLGFHNVRLLTNNPAKVGVFAANGITITEQVPLRVGRNVHNQNYLSVKALKSGHLL